jgi:histidine ammonia-lyase
MPDADALTLDGLGLTPDALARAAHGTTPVAVTDTGRARMIAARRLVDDAVATGKPVYGVTTGLGAASGQTLDAETLAGFSARTVQGRAHAAGSPLPRAVVRAAMIVRLNTFLRGGAAVRPAVADHLMACLNAGLTPEVGATGSIGAGDLVLNATIARALFGEGRMRDRDGHVRDARDALARAGLEPPALGPRDGLALCSHASVAAALAALGVRACWRAFEAAQTAAAVSMEGFRANLGPFDPQILAQRPQPGQAEAAAGIRERLDGGSLWSHGAARRRQDPLSIRCLPQIHGAVHAALDFARDAAQQEINGASDNPVALPDAGHIASTGAYHTPHLTNACETLARAMSQLAMAQTARIAKLLAARLTDLPAFLATGDNRTNGFAPALKTAEAAAAGIAHAAQPAPIWPSVSADGIEDALTNTPVAADALRRIAADSGIVTAVELLVAAQAVALRGTGLGPRLQSAVARIRAVSPPLDTDRALGEDIDTLAAQIASGAFA